jgi:hypothetical protein
LKHARTVALTVFALLTSAFAHAQTPVAGHPGFGKDERRPQGAPLVLPAGVEVAGPLTGADDDGNCPGPSVEPAGSGLWVRACLPLKNMNGGPTTIVFPPGLVIVSASETFQHGVLVEREVVTVPPTMPGGGQLLDDEEENEIVYVPLHLYCLNKGKEPSTPAARYELGPVTQHAGLSELYGFMESRNFKNDGDRVEVLQEVLWDVIENGRLSEENRGDLARGWYAS